MLDLPDLRGLIPQLLVQQDLPEIRETLELQALRVLQAIRAVSVLQAQREPKVTWEAQAQRGQQVQILLWQGQPARREVRALQVQLDRLVLREHRAALVLQDLRAYRGMSDLRALRDQQVEQAQQVPRLMSLVLLVQQVLLELLQL